VPESGGTGPREAEILLYQAEDGRPRIEVRFEGDTAWMTQAGLAELYQTSPQNITQLIAAIYAEGELEEAATCKSNLLARRDRAEEPGRREGGPLVGLPPAPDIPVADRQASGARRPIAPDRSSMPSDPGLVFDGCADPAKSLLGRIGPHQTAAHWTPRSLQSLHHARSFEEWFDVCDLIVGSDQGQHALRRPAESTKA
jgi:hypothetical protein